MKTIEIKAKRGTNRIIQKVIDDVWKSGGGTVKIGAGIFVMYDSLHLRPKVNIIGEKGATILKKAASVSSELSADLGYGHYDVSVKKPHLFKVGMGVYISDDQGRGFYGTVATIVWVDGDRIGINKMLNHDYARARNAIVSTIFPVISGYFVNGISIENITIDGNGEKNLFIDGCRGGGVFLLQCHGLKLSNVAIRNYNGDGISFQQCTRLQINNCEMTDNYGSGLHPGSGSVGAVIKNCLISKNKKDGVFFCLRVSYSLLESCQINENGNDGISIGARDTDHIIRKNIIFNNSRYGIYFRKADRVMGGHRNLIDSNVIRENCQESGLSEIFIEDINDDIWFKANKISGSKTEYGIIAGNLCKRIYIEENNIFTNFEGRAIRQDNTKLSYVRPPERIYSGPKFINKKKVRHLNIELS
ncbi:MAG: right-handed parallel beta-helix repeat-containing protein [Candidatus Omnitrophica bacterium]|nr:right-handed parallel beta-helix repeat-containing protein [Candidatus Omnitrophota bacterium]